MPHTRSVIHTGDGLALAAAEALKMNMPEDLKDRVLATLCRKWLQHHRPRPAMSMVIDHDYQPRGQQIA